MGFCLFVYFFFSSRRRHTRWTGDWSSDVCSSDLGLNQAADYLEMAARLLRIKAQMLLPRRLSDDEWEDPRSELVRRLLEYQQIRELVDWLSRAAARRAEQFGRGYEAPAVEGPPAPL